MSIIMYYSLVKVCTNPTLQITLSIHPRLLCVRMSVQSDSFAHHPSQPLSKEEVQVGLREDICTTIDPKTLISNEGILL